MSELTNGELGIMITDVAKDVTEIKVQTLKTNGRVTALEKWQSMLTGGLILVNIILVPLFLTLLIKYVLK